MNLSISNIAWNVLDSDIIKILKENNISNIEVALTKINESWNIKKEDLLQYKKKLDTISVYSIQSINYGTTYNLFDNNKEFLKHIYFVLECAKELESKVIVFGSPKNRFCNIKKNDADNIFIETMNKIGSICEKYDMYFCIEPNAEIYGCNYITNSFDALSILKKIDNKNIRLHLDAACMHLSDDFGLENTEIQNYMEHFHVSEPYLFNFDDPKDSHIRYSNILKKINYKKNICIEMKCDNDLFKKNIINAINFANNTYLK